MSNYTATVIKSGNSYALRIPKQMILDKKLELGQKVKISNLQKQETQNHQKVIDALKALNKIGVFRDIKDPVAWQRETRKEWDRKLPFRDDE